jgi:TolB-like protein/DNA-binding winged helix-turn-helix (wHTH) protein
MLVMEPSAPIFRFGPYESRSRTRELYKHGSKLKVRPQPLQVLNLLLSRPGKMVTREELREQLWSLETFVDFEHGLNTSVKEIRAVLNDSVAEPRYIETLPRLGYRFIAHVEISEPPVSVVASKPQAFLPSVIPSAVESPSRQRWPLLAGLGLVFALLVGLVSYFHWSHTRIRPQPVGGRVMLAVLPFQNLTGDPAQDYFSDGLTEEMIAQLGRLDPEHLGVIARTSVMHYKHSDEALDQIARELGVQYVLEGSVRRDPDKVRVSAQLIQMKDQTHVWSQQYDRELSNLLTLQDEIAQHIASKILVTLDESKVVSGNAAHQPNLAPATYEAFDLYLKGRYFWNKRTDRGFQQAADCFQQAVAKDPGYSRAYAGLADSYTLMSAYDVAPPRALIPKARAAALKALELDPNLAEAHVSLAMIAQNYDWDWQTAEKEFLRAISLDPNYATGHHWYAEHLALLGRFDDAFPEMQRARQLDPLSLIMQADNGAFLYFSRQYDPAIVQFRAVLDMEPNFPRANMIAFAYVQEGRYAQALADVENWRRVDNSDWILSTQVYVNGRAGHTTQARRAIDKLHSLDRTHLIDPLVFVGAYIGLGDKDQAFAWLDKSVANHSPGLTALKVDPIYDPLRNDPRFQVILRHIGLAQ